MARRVFLHLGVPRSGTASLQDRLALNRDALAKQGLTYPNTRTGDHFEAALDLIDERWASQREAARGQWASLVAEARKAPGDVLISSEILAAAGPGQIADAMAAFAPDEVHLVLTVRDLARQIPAEWLERLRQRGQRPFKKHMNEIAQSRRSSPELWFWRVQSVPDILTRWGNGLPPDRVHVVVVPPADAPREELWRRFATAVGFDPDRASEEVPRGPDPLGVAGAAVLRRLNRELAGRHVPAEVYADLVRELLAHETLPGAGTFVPVVIPEARWRFVERVTEEWTDWIEGAGVDVVGPLDDLRPRPPGPEHVWVHPDNPPSDQVAEAAIASLAAVITRVAPTYSSPLRRLAARVLRS